MKYRKVAVILKLMALELIINRVSNQKISIIRPQDKELLGFVAQSSSGNWEAQTVFGYVITRATSQAAAEAAVREEGLSYLGGVWQYYDKDDGDWCPCVIKEANQTNVTVVRTNVLGVQDRDSYKLVVIDDPSETNLIKT